MAKSILIIQYSLILYIFIILITPHFNFSNDAEITRNNYDDVEDWPFYQHDLQNTGYTSSLAPSTNSVRWTFGDMINTETSDIIAYNNVIYFPVGSPDNKFFAVDAVSGKELWNISSDVGFGTAALYDNTIFTSPGSSIIAINIDTHEIIWEFYPKSYEHDFSNSRLLVDETGVYFGAIYSTNVRSRAKIESGIYALERLTGKPIFKFSLETNVLSTTSLAIYQDRIYFGTSSHEIYCINRTGNNDGTILTYGTTNLIWKKFLPDDPMDPSDIYSEPTISNEVLFVGGNHNFFALDVFSGDEFWNYSTTNRITSSAAVDQSNVYFGNWGGIMYCLNKKTGEKVWSYKTDEYIDHHEASLSKNNKIIFLDDIRLYCLDTITGQEVWRFELNYPPYASSVHTTPTIYNGTVFIRVVNVYAIGKEIIQNTKPYFTKVEVEKSIANYSEEIEISIEAQDDDGDEIYFEYYADGGNIKKVDIKWIWTAPNETGFYNVFFNISDGILNDSLVLQFEVIKPNEAPVISDIIVDPKIVEPNSFSNITVYAIDTDGDDLDYFFNSTSGEIIGSGFEITWRAPKFEGIYKIKIIVYDICNATAFEEIYVIVKNINYPPIITSVEIEPDFTYSNEVTEVLIKVEVIEDNGLTDISLVTIDLSEIEGKSNQKLYDDGTHGDEIANDGVYSIEIIVTSSLPIGEKIFRIEVIDYSDTKTYGNLTFEIKEYHLDKNGNILSSFEITLIILIAIAILLVIFNIIKRRKKTN